MALSSGFGSVRRFNTAFAEHYGLNPTQLRKSGSVEGAGSTGTLRLAYRPPLDVAALLTFFERRRFLGVEWVQQEGDGAPALRRTVRLAPAVTGGLEATGWLSARFDTTRHQVLLQTSDSLYPVLPVVIARVRAMLDLDAEPSAINAVLHGRFPDGDGLRVPGAFDGFELAVRAVLGQQITVAAARTLGQRLVERLGEPLETPWPELSRLFPPPPCWPAPKATCSGRWASCASARRPSWRWRRRWTAGPWPCMPVPMWQPPRRPCAPCPASATGPRSTSPCACCAGPMPSRRATWHCTRPWACRARKTRPAPLPRHRRPGARGAAMPCCAPGRSYPCPALPRKTL